MIPNNGKQILVTGGTGLVGEALRSELLRDNKLREQFSDVVFLSTKDADLTDRVQAGRIFHRNRPTHVVHLAAKVGGLFANMESNDLFYKLNMEINENVLHWSNQLKVKKCISCLSTCIFPATVDYPLDETKIHLGAPHDSNVGYSLAKRHVDTLNKMYNKTSESSLFTSIIPTNIYGKGDNFNLSEAHVIPGLIHKAYLCAIEAKAGNFKDATLQVCGSGEPLRQFLYAPDLAKSILWALDNYNDPEPLIICPDEAEEVSIGHVARLIALNYSKRFNINMIVEFDVTKSDGQYKKTASNRKFRTLYSEFSFTSLEVGLEQVIDWFIQSFPDVRK